MKKMRKVVITAAGSGSRLLPFSKETPKEMLPFCVKSKEGKPILKPILEVIYESLYDYGYKEFCFVVGRGKRSIEDYFLVDDSNSKYAKNKDLQDFYKKIQDSHITYVQQSSPKGFGDAVLKAKLFAGKDSFLLHAGDDIILSPNNDHIKRLEEAFFSNDADLAFLVTNVKDPRPYGVIEGKKIINGIIEVKNLEEKPKHPKTNLAVIATYLFKPSIFQELEKIKPDKKGEIQLADAVKSIILKGKAVAVELKANEKRVDVGTPESYVACINDSFRSLMKT